MTDIQIITMYTQNQTSSYMIEKVSKNNFTLYSKSNETTTVILTKFNTAEDALSHATTFFNGNIVKIDNQHSDLLTEKEIASITKCLIINV